MLFSMQILTHPKGVDSRTLSAIREIFFESSVRKNFSDEVERQAFFNRWTDYYLQELPRFVYTAHDETGAILGYLTGCPDSRAAMSHFSRKIESYAVFADLFDQYPAHLHINMAESTRGRGLGKALVAAFLADLGKIRGVHIVTAPGVRNVNFYRQQNFNFECEREFESKKLLFMGRDLD